MVQPGKSLKGSVISNKYRLLAAREFLLVLKNRKLVIRHKEHENDGEWQLDELIKHMEEEIKEFKNSEGMAQLGELADISNMVDIIAMELLEHWRRL